MSVIDTSLFSYGTEGWSPPAFPRAVVPGEVILPQVEEKVPHHATFAASYNLHSKTYFHYFDEALRDSVQNTLAMRRDGFIHELLRHRQYPVATLPWGVDCDDSEDPDQKEAARHVERVWKAIHRFTQMKLQLLEASFYGKSGSQLVFGRRPAAGREVTTVTRHIPLNGDKIRFSWGGTPGVLVRRDAAPELTKKYPNFLINTEISPTLMLANRSLRERFVIHEFEPSDTDYLFEADMAGSVHGVGLRSRFYHTFNLRAQVLAWSLDALQRLSVNGMMFGFYKTGSPNAKQRMIDALTKLINTNVSVFETDANNTNLRDVIQRIEPGAVGYEILFRFLEYLDDILRRGFLGQNLTSESASTGLGSKVAELHGMTFENIVRYESGLLDETLNSDLMPTILRNNKFPYKGKEVWGLDLPFGVYYRSQTDRQDILEKISAARELIAVGVELDADDLRSQAGFKEPKSASPAPDQPERYATAEDVDRAAREADPSPSDAERESGNYRKGHVWIQGLNITIEVARGNVRSGKSSDGKSWSRVMPHHYGYIRMTTSDGDGEHVDCYIGPDPGSPFVFVVSQVVPETSRFDEHKVMLGFRDVEEAKRAYLDAYPAGWGGFGRIEGMTMGEFRRWLRPETRRHPNPVIEFMSSSEDIYLHSYFDGERRTLLSLGRGADAAFPSGVARALAAELPSPATAADVAWMLDEALGVIGFSGHSASLVGAAGPADRFLVGPSFDA